MFLLFIFYYFYHYYFIFYCFYYLFIEFTHWNFHIALSFNKKEYTHVGGQNIFIDHNGLHSTSVSSYFALLEPQTHFTFWKFFREFCDRLLLHCRRRRCLFSAKL